MSWSGVFKEAATSGKRELTVKRDTYGEKDAVAIETWEDVTLFKVRGLNHLHISGFPQMTSISPQITQLNSLLELILIDNGLQSLPEEIGTLTRLRLLDASSNAINQLPTAIYNLSSLQTLLLTKNRLSVESFPPCDGEPFPSLQHVNVVGNELTSLPDFVYRSVSILEVKASHNQIEVLSSDIGHMTSLKLLEMNHNRLCEIPQEMSLCGKLRFLFFEDNPIADHRLKKILAQFGATKPKAVLDYLKTYKKSKGKNKKGKSKVKTSNQEEEEKEEEDSDLHVEFSFSKPVIKIVRPLTYFEIKAMNNARQVRPYLVCTIVRGLHLDYDANDLFRRFLTLQVTNSYGTSML